MKGAFDEVWPLLNYFSPTNTNRILLSGRLEWQRASWVVTKRPVHVNDATIPASTKSIAPELGSLALLATRVGLGCVFSSAVCWALSGLSAISRQA